MQHDQVQFQYLLTKSYGSSRCPFSHMLELLIYLLSILLFYQALDLHLDLEGEEFLEFLLFLLIIFDYQALAILP